MNKFYYLEDMTQEDINKLALERNVLQSNWNSLREWLEFKIEQYETNKEFLSEERMYNVLDKMNKLEGDNNGIMD